jgi:uncharacterized membrane protein YukC
MFGISIRHIPRSTDMIVFKFLDNISGIVHLYKLKRINKSIKFTIKKPCNSMKECLVILFQSNFGGQMMRGIALIIMNVLLLIFRDWLTMSLLSLDNQAKISNTRILEEDCHMVLESTYPHIEKNSLS